MSEPRSVPVQVLAAHFDPDSLRAHFGNEGPVCALSEDALLEIGEEALWDEELWEAYHRVVARAVKAVAPHIPDTDLL